MVIEETVKIKASRQQIWETMLDVEFLLSSLPGLTEIEKINGNRYDAVLKEKIASMPIVFDMTIAVVDQQEPDHIEVRGDGKGRKGLGRVTFSHAVDLKTISAEETEVYYKLDLSVVGRLAALGGKAISKKVNEASDAFCRAFVTKFEG
jgi:carbon monoxide dehydrogenase subunit G